MVHLAIGTLTDLGWRGLSCGPGHTVSPSQTQSLTHQVLIDGIRNVLQRSPPGAPPTVIVGGDSGPPAVLVIDQGPGLPSSWPEVTAAFRHRDHRQPRHGAQSRLGAFPGLAEAMAGTLTPTVTQRGGLTVSLQAPGRAPTRRPRVRQPSTDQGECA